ncbi:MAG: hypothetical protein JRN21_09350 [Nitrososphaerota archaeon]|nr:hypothetical protein [Nitrososphaerota archaeon]
MSNMPITKDAVSELYDYAAAISLNGNENLAEGLRAIADLVVKERKLTTAKPTSLMQKKIEALFDNYDLLSEVGHPADWSAFRNKVLALVAAEEQSTQEAVAILQKALYKEQVADTLYVPPEYVERANPESVKSAIALLAPSEDKEGKTE